MTRNGFDSQAGGVTESEKKYESAHAPAFTIALSELVTELSHTAERDPTLLEGLLKVCDEFPIPHRHSLPVHINSAKATLRDVLGPLLPETMRPVPVPCDTCILRGGMPGMPV